MTLNVLTETIVLLQAYRSSAHVPTGSVPYRGSADRIPSPPPPASPTTSAASSLPPRFKSELQMRPESSATHIESTAAGTANNSGVLQFCWNLGVLNLHFHPYRSRSG